MLVFIIYVYSLYMYTLLVYVYCKHVTYAILLTYKCYLVLINLTYYLPVAYTNY